MAFISAKRVAMSSHLQCLKRIGRTLIPVVLMLGVAAPVCAQASASASTPTPQSAKNDQKSDPATVKNENSQLSSATAPIDARQAKIEEDTRKLFQLSAELRAEVAKTYKESLSLTVLKKAEEIERLAKTLKVLMNKEATASRH
jgi:beta-lactamase class A